ncbi:MAG: hypothetical protein J6X62_01580 [Bacteroidales bacterium]|nr:hypothetical protein [Bacteroidales bacterium]
MEEKKQNEEFKSRREFFKEAAKKALPIIGAIALASSTLLLSSCGDSTPVVTKVETVQEYNSTMEAADEALSGLGYSSSNALANTSYEYVLFDSHRQCNVDGASGYGFRTEKDSRNDKIDKYDRCIACGEDWINHKKR